MVKTWKTTCPADGYSTTVQANTKEEAIKLVMADPGMQTHVKESHPEMAGMDPTQMEQMLSTMTVEVTEPTAASSGV